MSEEPIILPVTDNGTLDRLAEAFEALGVSGETALNLLQSSFKNYESGTQRAAQVTQLIQTYFRAGGEAADALGAALSRLDPIMLSNAAASEAFITALQNAGVAEQAFGAKVAQTEAAIQQVRETAIASVYAEADAVLAASVRAMEALKMEEDAWSIHAAFVKSQAFDAANSINAALLQQANQQRIYSDLLYQQQLEDVQATEAAEAARTAAMRQAADLRVQAELAAEASRSAIVKEQTNIRMLAALEEEQARADAARVTAAAVAAAEAEMAAAANATAAAMARAAAAEAAAMAELRASVTEAAAAMKSSSGVLGGWVAQLGLLYSTMALFKDVDISQRINTQLQSLTGNVDTANALFSKLLGTAQATGAPVESVTKNFAQLDAVLAHQGLTTDQVATATDTLAKVMRGTGVAGEATARVMHELQEIVSGSANAGRAWNSIYAQSPALAARLAEILGVDLATAHGKQTSELQKATAALDKYNDRQAASGIGIQAARNAADSAATSLDNLSRRYANATNGTQLSAKAQAEWNERFREAHDRQAAANATLSDAATRVGTYNDKVKAGLVAKVADARASADQNTAMLLTSQAAQATANALNDTAEKNVKLSDSFNRLNNSFIAYLNTSGEAGAISRVFATVLGVIGDNLNVVIPLAILFGSVLVAWKLTDMIGSMFTFVGRVAELAGAMGKAAVSAAALELATAPMTLIFIGLAAVLVGILGYFGVFDGLLQKVKDTMSSFGQTLFGTSAYADELKTKVQDLSKAHSDDTGAVQSLTGAMKDYTASSSASVGVINAQTAAITNQTSRMQELAAAIGAVSLAQQRGRINNANGPQAPVDTSTYDGSAARYAAEHSAALGAGLGVGGSYGIQGFKTGGVVAGSSGPDTKFIAVSPGEHVTVQTPGQYYKGKVNTSNTSGKYRDGGVFAAFNLADQQSTTGYNTINPDDYYKSYDAPSASNDNSQSIETQINNTDNSTNTIVQKQSAPDPRSMRGDNVMNSDTTSGTTTTSDDGSAAAARHRSALLADIQALQQAQTATSIDGVQKPTGALMTEDQARKWVMINGQWQKRPGALPGISNVDANAVAAAYKKYKEDANKPDSAFRDGGSFTVPGTGGVDSGIIRMAVSPGERVSVETPEQQRRGDAVRGATGRAPVVNMTVYTKDANSFGQSQAQLLATAKRKLARA